jgi:integrator complex subunit 8
MFSQETEHLSLLKIYCSSNKNLYLFVSDPSPTELITKFLAISAEVNTSKEVIVLDLVNKKVEMPKPCRRSLGLKILALKIAAYLNWDLDVLEQK